MWDMGGYGIFIWPAYGTVLVGLLILAVHNLRIWFSLKKSIKNRNK